MLHEPIFYVKLLAVTLLLVNDWQLQRAERSAARGLAKGWARLRLTARVSGVLWFATVLVGVMLSNPPPTGSRSTRPTRSSWYAPAAADFVALP